MTTALDAQAPPSGRAPASPAGWAPARYGAWVWFGTLSVLYFAVGALLILRYNLFDPDAPSRVANAGYVFLSRDPHLSAIGFVWNPLPSLVQIPVLALADWWPELKTHGLAATVQSALFMSGAAVMVRGIAVDRGVRPVWRQVAVICFALQPMIIVYGASGMSEAAEIFCIVWCVRHLLRWVRTRREGDLALAGLALGVGYLARYEVVVAGVGAALVVAAVVLHASRDRRGWTSAALLVLIVTFPLLTAFVAWAVTGWVVTGELFATLSSKYGNGHQVEAAIQKAGPQTRAASDDWVVISARIFGMQPFVGVATAAAVGIAVVRRRVDALVPLAVFGPVLAFAAWGQYTSTTFGWFRFYLLAIPMVVCMALACWAPSHDDRAESRADTVTRRVGALLLSVSVLIGFPVTIRATMDDRIGNQQLQFGLVQLNDPERYPPGELWYRRLMVDDRQLAAFFDRRNLPPGAVLMDTFNTWGIWLASDNPKQFLITSDYDFTAALNRPWAFGVEYVVATSPSLGDSDAVSQRYPTMWADGAGFATRVLSVSGASGDERFRVYRVLGPPRQSPDGPAVNSP
ncbi:glycosyltransferase family 39 protein [Mycolicibacterium vaccae]|uniref:glycosyltransferase family 39 protein n=1 Tax=Mycolicibacterium vaccae TaxID=1810 RepID=UPI003CF10F77